jgi:integrase
MMVNFRVVFNRKNKLNAKGEALIQVEAYLDGRRRYFSTLTYVPPKEFNDNPRHNRYLRDTDQNNVIINTLTELRNFEMKYRAINGSFTLKDFDLMGHKIQANQYQTFTDFFEAEVENQKAYVSDLVWKQQRKNFSNFQNFAKRNVRYDEVNYELIQGFDLYLRASGLSINTAHKRHSQLKKYINLAIKKKLIRLDENPYLVFKAQTEEVDWVYLEVEELNRIEKLIFDKTQRLTEKARDMYLFGAYTGMRFGDIYPLKMSQFTKKDEILYASFRAQKTKKALTLPLTLLYNGKPEVLIEKYFREDGKRLFSGLTNPNVNLELKIIAKLARIEKRLHYHSSRHTFGSIGVQILPIKVVQEIMQHSDLRMTVRYTHLSDNTRDSILKGIDWKSVEK